MNTKLITRFTLCLTASALTSAFMLSTGLGVTESTIIRSQLGAQVTQPGAQNGQAPSYWNNLGNAWNTLSSPVNTLLFSPSPMVANPNIPLPPRPNQATGGTSPVGIGTTSLFPPTPPSFSGSPQQYPTGGTGPVGIGNPSPFLPGPPPVGQPQLPGPNITAPQQPAATLQPVAPPPDGTPARIVYDIVAGWRAGQSDQFYRDQLNNACGAFAQLSANDNTTPELIGPPRRVLTVPAGADYMSIEVRGTFSPTNGDIAVWQEVIDNIHRYYEPKVPAESQIKIVTGNSGMFMTFIHNGLGGATYNYYRLLPFNSIEFYLEHGRVVGGNIEWYNPYGGVDRSLLKPRGRVHNFFIECAIGLPIRGELREHFKLRQGVNCRDARGY